VSRESPRIKVNVLRREEVTFLMRLWHVPAVMLYTDELPEFRGWDRSSDPAFAWREYRRRRSAQGVLHTQLVVRLPDNRPIGESFFAPLPEGYTMGPWRRPRDTATVMGDIKLLPEYWGRGLGTIAMKQVTDWVFRRTPCSLFIVPPHRKNRAAERVYEKTGFVLFERMRSDPGHRVMELTRSRYERLRGGPRPGA
jgi:RimJ/RimL family protein N-acetyltransferase